MNRISEKLIQFFNNDATKWTQGTSARSKSGDAVPATDSRAICWCLTGALLKLEVEGELNNNDLLSYTAMWKDRYYSYPFLTNDRMSSFEELEQHIKGI